MNAIATRSNYQSGSYGGHDDAPSRHGGGGGRVKDSIMIGDGVLRFLDESGLLSAGGLDFVHAHEFGHHVQFRLDHAYPDDRGYDNDDDDNRREELMADAIGGYYLAHDEGGDATRREIDMFDDAAHATGDCGGGGGGGGGGAVAAAAGEDHHGTPDQRRCAAAWGARLAMMAVPATLLDPRSFAIKFDGAYGDILGLDAVACASSSPESTMAGGGGTTGSGGGEGGTTTTAPDSADAATIDLQDWLDYMGRGEEDDHREGDDDGGGGGEWEHPPEGGGVTTTTFGDNIHGPSPPLPGDDGGGPTGSGDDDRVVVAGEGTSSSSSSSWGSSRGKPDAVHRGDDHDGAAGTVDAGDDDDAPAVVPYGNFADRGTSPEETYQAYANHHGLMVDDCDMPWVYCISSGAPAQRRATVLGMICTISSSVAYFFGG